jgi:hypothetical protein
VVVNPLATFRVREARQLSREKTDLTDAEQIAELCRSGLVVASRLLWKLNGTLPVSTAGLHSIRRERFAKGAFLASSKVTESVADYREAMTEFVSLPDEGETWTSCWTKLSVHDQSFSRPSAHATAGSTQRRPGV